MAQFNPPVNPTQDPNYLGYSQPIRTPEPDKTLGVALKGVGDTLEVAAKGVDTIVKSSIDKQLYNKIDQERDQFSETLNVTKAALTGQEKNDLGPLNLLPQDRQQKPPGYVDDILRGVSKLQGATDAGKISPTAYIARLLVVAKDLRSQFPGWRDYIDSKISDITGMNPANAYVTSMVSDLNALTKGSSDKADKMDAFFRRKDILELPNASEMYQQYASGQKSETDIMTWANRNLNRKYTLEMKDAARKDVKGSREATADMTTDMITYDAGKAAVDYFDGVASVAGLNGTTSASKISELITAQASGKLIMTDAQNEQLAMSIAAQKRTAYTSLWKKYNTQKDPETGRTAVQDMGENGAQKVDSLINSQLKIFDLVQDAIKNKDYGTAFYHMNQSRAILDDTRHSLYTDKDVGNYVAKVAILNKDGGPEAAKELFKNGLLKDVNGKMRDWANNVQLGFATQPDLRNGGQARTIIDAIDAAKKQGYTDPKLNQDLVKGTAGMLTNPAYNDTIKANVVQAAYSEADQNLLKRFDKETVDPVTGKYKPGRYSVYTTFVNPAITKEMKGISERNNRPEVWQNYSNWAQRTFASDLFSSEINDLSAIQNRDDLILTWDDKNFRFDLKVNAKRETAFTDYHGIDQARRTINRLNQGIYGLKSVLAEEGKDVSAHMINLLIGMGYNPTEGQGTNMAQSMVNAIAAPRIRELLQKKMKEQQSKQ